MKTINTNFRNIATLVVVMLMTVVSFTANATGANNAGNVKSTSLPVEVKHVGVINEQPVLQVQFDNDAADEIIISFVDEDGTNLYSEKFSGGKYSKKFQFSNNAEGDLDVKLIVRSTKTNQTQTFNINKDTRIVEDVRISKL